MKRAFSVTSSADAGAGASAPASTTSPHAAIEVTKRFIALLPLSMPLSSPGEGKNPPGEQRFSPKQSTGQLLNQFDRFIVRCIIFAMTCPPGTPDTPMLTTAGTNLEQAKSHNRRVVIEAVRINGTLSRAEIARLTALSAQTVS